MVETELALISAGLYEASHLSSSSVLLLDKVANFVLMLSEMVSAVELHDQVCLFFNMFSGKPQLKTKSCLLRTD